MTDQESKTFLQHFTTHVIHFIRLGAIFLYLTIERPFFEGTSISEDEGPSTNLWTLETTLTRVALAARQACSCFVLIPVSSTRA